MAAGKSKLHVWLLCVNCGLAMSRKKSYAAKIKNPSCSYKCMGEFNSKTLVGASNPNFRNFPAKVCFKCGEKFFSRAPGKKFCSHRTSPEKAKPRENELKLKAVRGCTICLAPVAKGIKRCEKCKVKPSGKLEIKTCGKCGGKSSQPFRIDGPIYFHRRCREWSGERNTNYKGGRKDLKNLIRDNPRTKEIRVKVFLKDGFSCRMCGQVGGSLQLDHIKKFSEIFEEFIRMNSTKTKEELHAISNEHYAFWDLNNFQTLCKPCNFKKELDYRSFKRLESRLRSEQDLAL